MGILDFLRGKPEDQAVVFTGGRTEAELVMRILQEEGFHPQEWADMPAPIYTGPIGMARIVVPAGEGDAARQLLASLAEFPEEAWGGEEEEEREGEGE